MATVKTLKELGQALGRSPKSFQYWRERGVTIPSHGPYDVEAIKTQAIALGLYDKLGADPQGLTAAAGGSKMKEAASVYSLKQRIANLEYTNAKTAKILMETKAKQKDLVPVTYVHQGMAELAGELRELAVLLLQRGNAEATAAAEMMQERIARFAARNDSLFGTGAE